MEKLGAPPSHFFNLQYIDSKDYEAFVKPEKKVYKKQIRNSFQCSSNMVYTKVASVLTSSSSRKHTIMHIYIYINIYLL